MSLHEYTAARRLAWEDTPFFGLIMAAMWQADTDNLAALQSAFPQVWDELQARYAAPGGRLPTDPSPDGAPATAKQV